MLISPNTTFAHYRIISKLGAGGMGEVYLAQDTKLDRKVAIKFLNEEFSRDVDKLNRFIQEAKAASALNHPNILTVYEIGEIENQNYIATELIEGHTLRERLSRKEQLPLNQVLVIAVQIAAALSASHAAGIIHRDIKPENIMIRNDGYAKVLDFGLAKLSEVPFTSGSEDITLVRTNPGVVMGTVFYMSPEQARGNPTDARTDIWSLGVVLYEMLAQRLPFSGETSSHTMVAILEKEPAPVEQVPSELQRIVRKTLAKDANMRYQSARDLLIDLANLRRELDIKGEIGPSVVPQPDVTTTPIGENETRAFPAGPTQDDQHASLPKTTSSSSVQRTLEQAKSHKAATAIVGVVLLAAILTAGYFAFASRGSNAKQINSIAVMPFVNGSGNKDIEYLSDGLTDSLIFRISQLPNIKVSPTSSVMRFKNSAKDVAEIAKELDVDGVLTGRLMQVGDSMSISVQLIDARTQKLVWAEEYDRTMAQLMVTQREIASTLTQKMQLRLEGDERGITKKYTNNNEAYQLYLKGRYHYSRRTKEDLLKAIESYKQAIELDPNFALAYAAIAEVYNSMGKNPDAPPSDTIPLAKVAATRALELDPLLPQAHSALADSMALYDWNWAESEKHFKRALELDPNISYTHVAYGVDYLAITGNTAEVVRELERSVELEPLALINNAVLTTAYVYDRKYDKAVVQGRSAYDLDPSFQFTRHWLGLALVADGKYDEAIALSQPVTPDSPYAWISAMVMAHAYAKQGKKVEAEQQIALLRTIGKTRYVRPYYIASVYALLGDKDRAFAELERAADERDCYLARVVMDPFMDSLRNDLRYKALLKRMNL